MAPPRSFWRDLDPRALRVPVAMALVASFVLGQGDPRANLAESLKPGSVRSAAVVTLDAWLKPPAYTGKAPVVLTSAATIERLKSEPEILVPENSALVLRVNGAENPALSFFELVDGPDAKQLDGLAPAEKTSEGLYQSETIITRPVMVEVMDGERELVSWRMSVIPDTPPTVVFTKDPEADASGALTAFWKLTDDYGVTGCQPKSLSPTNRKTASASNRMACSSSTRRNSGEPAQVLAEARRRQGQRRSDRPPVGGLHGRYGSEARDAAGHATASEVKRFKLPERLFMKPLARALIEQRKELILDPDNGPDVSRCCRPFSPIPRT